MKKIILILFVFLNLESCSKKQINSNLIGNWVSIKSANTVQLKFYKDSLIIHQWGKKIKNNWTSNSSKIYFTQLTEINPEEKTEFEIEYKFNFNKDTLYVKNSIDSVFTNQFIKDFN